MPRTKSLIHSIHDQGIVNPIAAKHRLIRPHTQLETDLSRLVRSQAQDQNVVRRAGKQFACVSHTIRGEPADGGRSAKNQLAPIIFRHADLRKPQQKIANRLVFSLRERSGKHPLGDQVFGIHGPAFKQMFLRLRQRLDGVCILRRKATRACFVRKSLRTEQLSF